MYGPPYGYPNPAGGPAFNSAPPQQNPHLQPGPSPGQQQQQQHQQMMYNPQQFPMGAQGGHFPAGPNPAMMGGAGPAGMMQNTAMPHMGANGQMAYQTPFTSSPYGPGVPASVAPQVQLPGNYMMAGGMAPFQMNPGMAPQQPMMPRMHPSQQNPSGMNASTPQRPFNPSQGTPNNAMPSQQAQFSTPQPHGPQGPGPQSHGPQSHGPQSHGPQSQTPTQPPQQPPSAAQTPQTPTFPATGQQAQTNGTSVSTPQSPATESREKERFALLLDINQELLYELISLTNSKAELKKAQEAAQSGQPGGEAADYAEEERLTSEDYQHCMIRLHTNLAYMAALADRKSLQAPPCPAYLLPPHLNLKLKLRVPQSTDDDSEKPPDPNSDREERDQMLKDLYKKLQALFPGVDPRKEPVTAPPNRRPGPPVHQQQQQQQQQQQGNPAMMMKNPNGQMMSGQGSNHSSPAPGPQAQKTPQMTNAAAPMIQAQAAGS